MDYETLGVLIMADKMHVIITARKEVADVVEARSIYDWVKDKLSEHPDVEVNGQASNHFDLDQE